MGAQAESVILPGQKRLWSGPLPLEVWSLPKTENGCTFEQVRGGWHGVVIKMVVDLLAAQARPRRPQPSLAGPLGPSERGPSITGVLWEGRWRFSVSQLWGSVFNTDLVKFKLSTAQTLKAYHSPLGTLVWRATLKGLC